MTDPATRATLAAELRGRAETILVESGLLNLFAQKFGEVAPTGSFANDLMVWPDIDIHIPVAPDRRADWLALVSRPKTAPHLDTMAP